MTTPSFIIAVNRTTNKTKNNETRIR